MKKNKDPLAHGLTEHTFKMVLQMAFIEGANVIKYPNGIKDMETGKMTKDYHLYSKSLEDKFEVYYKEDKLLERFNNAIKI